MAQRQVRGDVDRLDLLKEPMPFFDEASMTAYMKRNYGLQAPTPDEARSLAAQDRLIKRFKAADVILMAYRCTTSARRAGQAAKALTLYTAGGIYPSERVSIDFPNWDTLTFNARINFTFMGFDEAVVIGTSLRDTEAAPRRLQQIDEQITSLFAKWYG